MVFLFKHKFTNFTILFAAEDWLIPSVVLEAFEARATRLSVACAQNLSKFSNQEEGISCLSFEIYFIFLFFHFLQVSQGIMSMGSVGVGTCTYKSLSGHYYAFVFHFIFSLIYFMAPVV